MLDYRPCASYQKPPDVDPVSQTCADVQEEFIKEPLLEGEVINFTNARLRLYFTNCLSSAVATVAGCSRLSSAEPTELHHLFQRLRLDDGFS